MKICLTIGGSDTSSGAGIQQDLKVFSSLCVYGVSVITCITAQNLKNVSYVKFCDKEIIKRQIDSILDEFKIDSIKIGLIGKKEIGEILCKKINKFDCPVVFDPIIESTTGFKFIDNNAIDVFKKISEISKVITPNKKEAEFLSEISIKSANDFEKAAKVIGNYCENVVIKDEGNDYCYINGKFFILKSEKINFQTHGSGCTFSSAISAYLAKGYNIEDAIKKAKEFTYNSIINCIFKYDISKKLKILNPFYDIEKARVKENINKALEILNKCKDKEKICPEVGMNIAEVTNFSDDIEDVAEFSGRIFYDSKEDKFVPVGKICFNLKKHLSRALITYKNYIKEKNINREINCVINIKFSEENLEKLKKINGIEISYFEREKEKTKNIEGKTMEYGIIEALEKNKNAEIIYDKGSIGKEPMIRIFGKDAIDVANKILKIFS